MHHDARVRAQLPIELTGAAIDGMHAGRSGLQEDVGEAAGGRADIEADFAGDVERKVVQRARELESAAAHVGRAGEHVHGAIVRDQVAGFGRLLPVDAHLSGHDEGLGFLAGFGETAVDHQTVQPSLHDLRRTIRSASSWRRSARSPNGASTAWARSHSSCAMRREVSRP